MLFRRRCRGLVIVRCGEVGSEHSLGFDCGSGGSLCRVAPLPSYPSATHLGICHESFAMCGVMLGEFPDRNSKSKGPNNNKQIDGHCASAEQEFPIEYTRAPLHTRRAPYTRSPLEDSRLFGPSPWKILATTYDKKWKKRFLSNPAPGENILSGNLVMETGCIYCCYIITLLYCIITLHCNVISYDISLFYC